LLFIFHLADEEDDQVEGGPPVDEILTVLVQRLEDILLEGNLKKQGGGGFLREGVRFGVEEEERTKPKKNKKCPRGAGPASRRYFS